MAVARQRGAEVEAAAQQRDRTARAKLVGRATHPAAAAVVVAAARTAAVRPSGLMLLQPRAAPVALVVRAQVVPGLELQARTRGPAMAATAPLEPGQAVVVAAAMVGPLPMEMAATGPHPTFTQREWGLEAAAERAAGPVRHLQPGTPVIMVEAAAEQRAASAIPQVPGRNQSFF